MKKTVATGHRNQDGFLNNRCKSYVLLEDRVPSTLPHHTMHTRLINAGVLRGT